jgi:hypothetical protein
MRERYTHPTVERKRAALETFDSLARNWPQSPSNGPAQQKSRPKTTFSSGILACQPKLGIYRKWPAFALRASAGNLRLT